MFGKSKQDAPKDEKKHSFGGSLFGKHEEISPVTLTDISNQLSNIGRRLRILEESFNNLRKNTQLTDQNLLRFSKDMKRETTVTNSDIIEIRRDFIDLKEKTKLIVKELIDCAKSEDVKVLEKYIAMWDPVKFMTKNDVERIVEDKLSELKESSEDRPDRV